MICKSALYNTRLLALLLLFLPFCARAQDLTIPKDASLQIMQETLAPNKRHRSYQAFVLPAAMIGYGMLSLDNKGLRQLNLSTRDRVLAYRLAPSRLDDYTQYAPAILVYGLNAAGLKGQHNFRDRTLIYLTAQVLTAAMVVPLKRLTQETRPDGSNNHSFPSGHTATAFSAAQFMFREYKDQHLWLGLSGYTFALFTGAYRIINNKHWVSDVIAGAGFGILSTELAYRLYPTLNGLLFGRHASRTTMLMPYYQPGSFGISLVKTL